VGAASERQWRALTDERALSLHEVAADWLMRVRSAPADAALARAFEDWLDESEDNRRAFAGVARSWQLIGEVPPAYANDWAGEAEPVSRPTPAVPRPRRWRALVTAVALAACLVAFLAYPALLLLIEADYRTSTGTSRAITLDDGTRIALGADSAIAVDMAADRRMVRLLQGEAFFDVQPDPARPFVVDAGGVDVSVLGTSFNVRLSSADMVVELAEGSVDLDYPGHAGARARLAPGQSALVDLDTGRLTRGEIAPQDIGTWREGRLFVQDATIADVVEQLQRYHRAWIAVPDGALAARRVTGLYDLTDPDRALRALVEPHGGRMREISPYMRVLSRF
jgi:transmembrane sensor